MRHLAPIVNNEKTEVVICVVHMERKRRRRGKNFAARMAFFFTGCRKFRSREGGAGNAHIRWETFWRPEKVVMRVSWQHVAQQDAARLCRQCSLSETTVSLEAGLRLGPRGSRLRHKGAQRLGRHHPPRFRTGRTLPIQRWLDFFSDMATSIPRLGVLPRRAILSRPSPRALCAPQARQPPIAALGLAPFYRPTSLQPFHSSAPRCRPGQHFDTLRFVQKLQDEGFTEEQAAALMKILNDVMEER